ncbi:MAG: LytR C-terminal domain-containing protein [Gemmatimonadetes bacterium]|nr:LytR C-terminal domain-containing protein [Gemmatimonadota bacterium]
MSRHSALETVGAGAALLVCAAFVASFAFGLGRAGSTPDAAEPGIQAVDIPVAAGRVEVLNGSGRAGMARAVTQRLRSAGFDVLFFGNAPASAGDSSTVIARSGNDAIARAVAGHLGITRITSEPDTDLHLDATVILGRDFQ